MFERIARTYLKWTGKKHLVPFLDGLFNIGRPSTVFFPLELMEQGVGLLLSGLNNTLATQSHPDWIWPWWLERQQDPNTREFIPVGVNVLTINLSLRNWISLGLAGSPRESMLDPVGMLTLHPFGWSIFPYVKIENRVWIPPRLEKAARQTLLEGTLPQVRTDYEVDDRLGWASETIALRESDEELVYFRHELENKSNQPLDLVFGLAIRPYNMLALGHINKLKFKNRLWRVNRKPGWLVLKEPDRNAVADRHLGDPLTLDPARVEQNSGVSRSGILAGVSEYDVRLEPGETWDLMSLGILTQGDVRKRKFRHLKYKGIEEARERRLEKVRRSAREGMVVGLPDPLWEAAFYAVKNHMHVFDDVEHFTPGTFFYHNSWIRDSAFIALAYENLGLGDRVALKMKNYLKMQQFDGFFRSQNGEWDSAGQALFTMIDHVRRNGDRAQLAHYWGSWRKAARWIEDQCRKTRKERGPHSGLLPAGFSAEHFGPNDHYFWDNFWALAGLKMLLWVARKLDKVDEKLERFYEEYSHRVQEVIILTSDRQPDGALPSSPYRKPDSASIGNLVAVSPLDLVSADALWVKPTVDYLMEHNLRKGLFFQKIIHTGLNAYLTVQLARVLIALGDRRAVDLIHSLLQAGAPTYTWPEAVHPATMGGCMGDGDHGWAAAEVLMLLRETLIRETGDGLELAALIDADAVKAGTPLICRGASTSHGTVDYTLVRTGEALVLDWTIQRAPLQDPVPTHFRLPSGWTTRDLPVAAGRVALTGDGGKVSFQRASVSMEEVHP